jgi:hypothetical protein
MGQMDGNSLLVEKNTRRGGYVHTKTMPRNFHHNFEMFVLNTTM